jgi:hypothetical protein
LADGQLLQEVFSVQMPRLPGCIGHAHKLGNRPKEGPDLLHWPLKLTHPAPPIAVLANLDLESILWK